MLCSPTFCLLKVTFEFRGERVLRPHDAPRSAEAIVDRRYSVEQVVARETSVAVDTIAKGPNKIEVDFRDQNLRLLRQTRNMREARRPAARTHTYEALLRLPVEGLRADVARLALRVLGARLRRDRHGLRVLFICVVLLGTTSLFYWFAERVVASLLPVLFLAFRPTVARAAAAAFLAQG